MLTDADGDGFYPDNECGIGPMGDCDDNNPLLYPREEQDWYYLEDLDEDGWHVYYPEADFYGTCPPSVNYRTYEEAIQLFFDDCDDTNPDVHPGAPELCDDIDNNCDGRLFVRIASTTYEDQLFENGAAFFGTTGTVSGEFVHYDAATGCDPIADDLTGKIAIIDRGLCFFSTKSVNAQNAGAIGVIICNYDDVVLNMSAGTLDEITIPVVMLSSSDCQTVLDGGGTVSFTVEDTCVEPGAVSASDSNLKTAKIPSGFEALEKVTK